MRAALLFPALLPLAGCAAPDRSALPAGPAGAGLLSSDGQPPPGTETVAAARWTAGQTFALAAGSWGRADFLVADAGPAGYVLDEAAGLRQYLTPGFAVIGQERPGAPHTLQRNDPPDPILDFPLWPGKRWSAEFALRVAGAREAPLLRADYACEAWDLLPARGGGELRALRIVRRLRRAGEAAGREEVSVYWWSPTEGFFARKLEDGVLLEFEAARRP